MSSMAIVCGSDLSEKSRDAAIAAAALARRLREPIVLAHAVGDAAFVGYGLAREPLLERARERLEAEIAHLDLRASADVRAAVLEGNPERALLALARAERAGLVVVASQGHGASPLYRLGGTSERIALHATMPVLVVRDSAPFTAWANGERPLRALAAVDFSPSAATALRWLDRLRAAAPCDVTALHLYYADEARHRHGLPWDGSRDAELQRLLERDVASAVGALGGAGSVAIRVERGLGRLADDVVRVAEAERADLVVVGTHHRRGPARLWSVSSGVLHLAPMSVATIAGGAV